MEMDLSWLRTSWFHYIVCDIATQNGIVPEIFGYEQCSPKKTHLIYDKNCYSIHFILKGEGTINSQMAKEGDCFILAPHCKYEYYPNPNSPWEYVWIEYNGYVAERFTRHAGFAEENYILRNIENISTIMNVFKKIFTEAKTVTNKHARTMFFEAYTTESLGFLAQEKGYEITYRQKSISYIILILITLIQIYQCPLLQKNSSMCQVI